MEIGAGTGMTVRRMAGPTVRSMAGRMRAQREARRATRLHDENDRLRAQLQVTRSELDHERDLEHEMLDVLTKAAEHPTKVTAKTRGGLLRMATVAAVAYVFGTKAGHERYEHMRSWLSEMRYRMADAGALDDSDGVDTSHPGLGPRPNPLMESGIRRA